MAIALGRQIPFFGLAEDQKPLLTAALGFGAHIVCHRSKPDRPIIISTPEQLEQTDLDIQNYLWLPSASPIFWAGKSRTFDLFETQAIEYMTSRISPSGALVSGRLYMPSNRLTFIDGRPVFVPNDDRLVKLYENLVKLVKKSFMAHHSCTRTYYIGRAALQFHQAGGRLKPSGGLGDLVIGKEGEGAQPGRT